MSGIRLYQTATGPYWLPEDTAPSDAVLKEYLAGRYFDGEIIKVGLEHIRPSTIAIDIGACAGQMSFRWAEKAGKVIAVECDELLCRCIEATAKERGLENVEVINRAAAHVSGLTVPRWKYRPHYGGGECSIFGTMSADIVGGDVYEKDGVIQTLALQDLSLGMPVSLIKSDCQGCDLLALQGAEKIILRDGPAILVELESYGYGPEKLLPTGEYHQAMKDLLVRLGYRVERSLWTGAPNWLCLPEKR